MFTNTFRIISQKFVDKNISNLILSSFRLNINLKDIDIL